MLEENGLSTFRTACVSLCCAVSSVSCATISPNARPAQVAQAQQVERADSSSASSSSETQRATSNDIAVNNVAVEVTVAKRDTHTPSGNTISTDTYPIAGIRPDQRPQGAPRITQSNKDEQWYANALNGVSTPYPSSLKMLEDQGNWYTPFSHPGMPGNYDIRGWFQP